MKPTETLLILNSVPDCGPVKIARLLNHFQKPEDILSAPRSELKKVRGISDRIANNIVNWHNTFSLDAELAEIEKQCIKVITILDPDYPENLKQIYDPPIVLYLKGNFAASDKNAIAIVGTRRPTNYGRESSGKLARQLAANGVTIVSGLARGIDAAAHRAALEAKGRTIAVLGSGLGQIYPPENADIAEMISDSGAVISEFPMDVPPLGPNFPQRNRIISGLSLGVLVAEAPRRSGAIITAHQALEQNRHVFTIPGRIDMPSFSGNHYLLKQGAKLVEGIDDILGEFEFLFPEMKAQIFGPEREDALMAALSDEERQVYQLLSVEETSIEDIIDRTEMSSAVTSTVLLSLEMKKLVRQLPGKQFARLSR